MKTQRVWGIFYRVRASSGSKWCNWVGPCGAHILSGKIDPDMLNALRGRPFFFRTRNLARDAIKKIGDNKNTTWTWVQYKIRPIKLTYEIVK